MLFFMLALSRAIFGVSLLLYAGYKVFLWFLLWSSVAPLVPTPLRQLRPGWEAHLFFSVLAMVQKQLGSQGDGSFGSASAGSHEVLNRAQ